MNPTFYSYLMLLILVFLYKITIYLYLEKKINKGQRALAQLAPPTLNFS